MRFVETIKKCMPGTIAWLYGVKLYRTHKSKESSHVDKSKGQPYYIIRYNTKMNAGWTMWERAILFSCIYATEKGMLPVVDMCNSRNMYQEEDEFGKVNSWENMYEQPCGVSYDEAILSNNYILSDPSEEWIQYLRMRNPRKYNTEYLRAAFAKFIRLNMKSKEELEQRYEKIMLQSGAAVGAKMVGMVLRGTDYKLYHHPVQPSPKELADLAKDVAKRVGADYYYVATEDASLFAEIKKYLPNDRIISFQAGEIENTSGLIGDYIRLEKTAKEASIDYMTVLYMLNKCSCLYGGWSGAMFVAAWRKTEGFEDYLMINDRGNY